MGAGWGPGILSSCTWLTVLPPSLFPTAGDVVSIEGDEAPPILDDASLRERVPACVTPLTEPYL